MRRPIPLLALVASTFAAGGDAGVAAAPLGEEPARIERGEAGRRLLLTGSLVARDAAALVAPNVGVSPLVVRWVVEDGAEVAPGDPVVELDNGQLAGKVEGLRVGAEEAARRVDATAARVAGEVAAAERELERAEVTLAKAQLEAAIPAGLLPEQQLAMRRKDRLRAEREREEAAIKLAARRAGGTASVGMERLALERAVRALERAESGVALLTLRAPRAGIALVGDAEGEGRRLRSGDTVWPGATLARLPELGTLVVVATLFDVDDGAVVPGQAALATLDAFPHRSLAGRVESVAATAREHGRRSRRRSFAVVVKLAEIDADRMRPGMSVKVEILAPAGRLGAMG